MDILWTEFKWTERIHVRAIPGICFMNRGRNHESTAAYCDYFRWKRRWAKAKGMPRNYGHAQGSKNVERICEEAWRMGIKYLTVYAFSTENWSRPESEVAALMKLLPII